VITDLEKGVRPWLQPWNAGHAAGRIPVPRRHNGVPYRGINILLLWGEAIVNGYASPLWMTFKQALTLEADVRRGEHGAMVVFVDRFTKKETDADGNDVEREIPFLKAYTVFNVAQIEGLPAQYSLSPRPRARSSR
jgi:antirestriction protein ArdC